MPDVREMRDISGISMGIIGSCIISRARGRTS